MRWMVWLGWGWMLAAQVEARAIVLLYADDWRHDLLGCAGHPVVKTPHVDGLAKEGVRMTRAAVTTSICGVSRASLLTGQWMSRHGNRGFERFRTPWEETLVGRLRAGGYRVGHVGKWHNGAFPAECYDWSRVSGGRHWVEGPGGMETVTAKQCRDAIEFLRSVPEGEDFFLMVSFFAPHAEDDHPEQYRPSPVSEGWLGDGSVEVDRDPGGLPDFLRDPRNESRRRDGLRFDPPEKGAEFRKRAFRMMAEVDAACGEILEVLRAIGRDGDTLVVFTADNGVYLGEKGLADKWYPYDPSLRVPMVVRDPRLGREKRGCLCEEWVLNVDVAPTFLEWAGLEVPKGMQGRNFSGLYLGEEGLKWRQEFYYEHPVIRSVDFIPSSEALVTRDEKFIFWPDHGVEQWFRLREDVEEREDLVPGAAHEVLEPWRKRLAAAREAVR